FNWTIPNVKETLALVRVYDITDGTVDDESNNTFNIKPRIVFEGAGPDQPLGGETYLFATPQTIDWTTYGPVTAVDIDYSIDNGNSWETPELTTSESNTDTFDWTIPDAVSGDVRVRVTDSSDTTTNAISEKFRIRSIINLLTPNGGVPVDVGDTVTIQWNQQGATSNIYLYYLDNLVGLKLAIDGATGGNGIISNPAPDGGGNRVYSWSVPDFINNNVKVGVSDPNDINGTKDESTAVFPIRASFTINQPTTGTKWDIGSTQTLDWSWTGTVDGMNLYYSLNGINYTAITLVSGLAGDPDKRHTYDWFINPGGGTPITPSSDFYIKVTDATDDLNALGISLQAKVRADLTLDVPPLSEYVVFDTYTVTWSSVGLAGGEDVDLHYSLSSDGSTFPNPQLIVSRTPNDGTHDWGIPDDISSTVRVRVIDSDDVDAYAIHQADFRIKGDVWVTSPVLNDNWDVGQDYNITWGWKGTIPEMEIRYSINGAAGPFNTILESYNTVNDGIVQNSAGSGGPASSSSYLWTVPDQVAPAVMVRVTDARPAEVDVTDDSDTFHIVGFINVETPISSDRLEVDSSFGIRWEWGGTMATVKITYSTTGDTGVYSPIKETYGTPDDGIVANGSGGGGPGSTHTYMWTVPDDISSDVVIRVADPNDEINVKDESQAFKIQGKLTLLTPAVALNDNNTPGDGTDDFYESRWITNEVREISWLTNGTIPNVNLVYTKNDFTNEIAMASGTGYANTPLVNDNDTPSDTSDDFTYYKYDWVVPDDRDNSVKVRVYDAQDDEVYTTGPVPLGGVDTMKIDYYSIKWIIVDLLTNAPIEGLVVDDTSGFSSSGLISPVTYDVPASSPGLWKASWTHKDFGDIAEEYLTGWDVTTQKFLGDRTIFRTMETKVVHIWRAFTEFTYNAEDDILETTSWLERDGSLVPGVVIFDINIYDGFDRIRRMTVVVDDNGTIGDVSDDKFLNYLAIPDSVKLWVGTRFNDNGTPDDFEDDFDEVRTVQDVITDTSAYKVGEEAVPSGWPGFFLKSWAPTGYTADGVTYTTLQPGKVYAVSNYGVIGSGASFTTPVSFSVTAASALEIVETLVTDMLDTVNNVLDKPISEVSAEIQAELVKQTGIIETKLDEQTVVIKDLAVDIEETINTAITSFETNVAASLVLLEEAADDVQGAADLLDATAKKNAWSVTVSPNPALIGEDIRMTIQGLIGLRPVIDIFDFKNNVIHDDVIPDEIDDGQYEFVFTANSKFPAGKAYTYIVTESTSDAFVAGSGTVETTSISTIAGLAAAAPAAQRAAQAALNAIKEVQAVLMSGEKINIALTLKSLKDSVEALPDIMAKDGPSALMTRAINDISERLRQLAGDEGYDLSTILDQALADNPTLKDVQQKTRYISGAVEVMQEIFEHEFGGIDDPFVIMD
ncbi:hypothetical protein IIB34_00760, partial [PVC group bacterium]|nr:hypothetical protein [PVC group bacterium]